MSICSLIRLKTNCTQVDLDHIAKSLSQAQEFTNRDHSLTSERNDEMRVAPYHRERLRRRRFLHLYLNRVSTLNSDSINIIFDFCYDSMIFIDQYPRIPSGTIIQDGMCAHGIQITKKRNSDDLFGISNYYDGSNNAFFETSAASPLYISATFVAESYTTTIAPFLYSSHEVTPVTLDDMGDPHLVYDEYLFTLVDALDIHPIDVLNTLNFDYLYMLYRYSNDITTNIGFKRNLKYMNSTSVFSTVVHSLGVINYLLHEWHSQFALNEVHHSLWRVYAILQTIEGLFHSNMINTPDVWKIRDVIRSSSTLFHTQNYIFDSEKYTPTMLRFIRMSDVEVMKCLRVRDPGILHLAFFDTWRYGVVCVPNGRRIEYLERRYGNYSAVRGRYINYLRLRLPNDESYVFTYLNLSSCGNLSKVITKKMGICVPSVQTSSLKLAKKLLESITSLSH